MIEFWVPGDPKPQPRPRFNSKTGRVYNPDSADEWKERIMWRARESGVRRPMTGPLCLELKFSLARGGEPCDPHAVKPDLDNLVKATMDALNRIAWADDAQVSELNARKVVASHRAAGLLVKIRRAEA